jgi:SNF2 family DNA or RNA helicase
LLQTPIACLLALTRPPTPALLSRSSLPSPPPQVEIIALALAHPPPVPWPSPAPGAPGVAWPAPGRPGGNTLVVAPQALVQQWQNELRRHSGLRVEVYEGMRFYRQQARRLGCGAGWGVAGRRGALAPAPPPAARPCLTSAPPPRRRPRPPQREDEERRGRKRMSKEARAATAALELMQYCLEGPPEAPAYDAEAEAAEAARALLGADVVLTTYAVLQAEVHLAPNHEGGAAGRALRRPKRYRVPESPLLQIHWWRLVFDEAQQVLWSCMARREEGVGAGRAGFRLARPHPRFCC